MKTVKMMSDRTIKRHIRELLDICCKPACFGPDGHMRIYCRDCGGPGHFQQGTGVPLPEWAEDYAWAVWEREGARAAEELDEAYRAEEEVRRELDAAYRALATFPEAINRVGPEQVAALGEPERGV